MEYEIVGYTPRWSVRTGQTVPLHVSSLHDQFWVHLLRVTNFIDSPDGWAQCEVEQSPVGPLPGEQTELNTGSCLVARNCQTHLDAFAVEVTIWTRAQQADLSTVFQIVGEDGAISVVLRPDNSIVVTNEQEEIASGLHVIQRQWTRVRLSVDDEHVAVSIHERGNVSVARPSTLARLGRLRDVVFGGQMDLDSPSGVRGSIDAKLEGPAILSSPGHEVLTGWNLGKLPYEIAVPDSAGYFEESLLINEPTRAVTGSGWRGHNTAFQDAPQEYAAAYFHRDDLGDAGWPIAHEIRLPEDLAPGVLCAVLSIDETPRFDAPHRWFPVSIFVATPAVATSAPPDITLVLPTFSYRSYSNNGFHEEADPAVYLTKRETSSKHAYEYIKNQGLQSHYGQHPDGAGVHLASLKRPQATVRPDWVSQLVGRPHQLSADLTILGWLARTGYNWAVTTDEFLHDEGAAALGGARTVLTGSHPEYSSDRLLNAYDDHLSAGGHLVYLGGNGFILRVDVPLERPWLQELRRTDAGGDIWASEPGEMHHQTSGRQGGMWRHIGRPPNLLTGVGYSAIGFSRDTAYKAPQALNLEALPSALRAVMEDIGDNEFGLCGFEIDCFDTSLGSNPRGVVIGQATRVPSDYRAVHEYLDRAPTPSCKGTTNVHGDVVWSRTGAGGQIFAVGSISWTRGLMEDSDPGRCREILEAVLHDMVAQEA